MQRIIFCLVALLTLTPVTWAQVEETHSSAETNYEAKDTLPISSTPGSLTGQSEWQVRLTNEMPLPKGETSTRAAVLSLKPEPLTLATLAQGRSNSVFGMEFSIGGFRPGGQLRDTNLIRTAVAIGVNAGFRPGKTALQLDAGLDLILDGIGSSRQQEVIPGYFRNIDDVETMLYFGPRVYLTPRDSRLQLSLGGGGTFAYYKEFLETDENDDFDFRCFSCEGRSGWGFYGMGQLRYQITPAFGVGVTAKYYRVTTEGEAFSNNLARRTTDDWLGFMLTFSFR